MNPSNNLDYEPLGRLNYLLRRTLDIKERVEYFRRYGHGFSKGAEKLAKWSISYCDAIVSGLSDKYFRRKLLKTELRVERIHKGLEEYRPVILLQSRFFIHKLQRYYTHFS